MLTYLSLLFFFETYKKANQSPGIVFTFSDRHTEVNIDKILLTTCKPDLNSPALPPSLPSFFDARCHFVVQAGSELMVALFPQVF